MIPIDAVPAAGTTVPAGPRIVIVGVGGGEGSSTVTALLAAVLAGRDEGTPRVIGRPDDALAARWAEITEGVGGGLLVDAGPHAGDETLRADDVLVTVCAATTGSIERARVRVAEADARGLTTAALVICARTVGEERRGRVRMQQAVRADPRIVALAFDPALAASRRIESGALSPTTLEAGRALVRLLPVR